MTSTRVVVSLGIGEWYPRGQARLRTLCQKFHEDFISWGEYPEGCPTHQEVMYGFKPFVVQHAFDKGYESVLWMDSSAVIEKPLDPIWEIIEKEGAFIPCNGWTNEQWTHDLCFELCGTPKEQYGKLPHCSALVCGFSRSNPVGRAMFDEWLRLAKDGRAFNGPLVYGDGKGMPKGHRGDQSVLSLLAAKHGFEEKGPEYLRQSREGAPSLNSAYPA